MITFIVKASAQSTDKYLKVDLQKLGSYLSEVKGP